VDIRKRLTATSPKHTSRLRTLCSWRYTRYSLLCIAFPSGALFSGGLRFGRWFALGSLVATPRFSSAGYHHCSRDVRWPLVDERAVSPTPPPPGCLASRTRRRSAALVRAPLRPLTAFLYRASAYLHRTPSSTTFFALCSSRHSKVEAVLAHCVAEKAANEPFSYRWLKAAITRFFRGSLWTYGGDDGVVVSWRWLGCRRGGGRLFYRDDLCIRLWLVFSS
jgi:hypothetical protein